MIQQARRISLAATLALALAGGLGAQDKLNLGLIASDDGIVYQFQGRVVQAGSGMDSVVGNRTGGGVGFSAMFGDRPLRLRVRMDWDGFEGKDWKGSVNTTGLGADGVFFLPSFDWVTPFFSCGVAFQHWVIGENNNLPGERSRTSNRLAGRAELGLKLGRRTLLSVGILLGKAGDDQSAANLYLAVTY
jgi:hypothetical protein